MLSPTKVNVDDLCHITISLTRMAAICNIYSFFPLDLESFEHTYTQIWQSVLLLLIIHLLLTPKRIMHCCPIDLRLGHVTCLSANSEKFSHFCPYREKSTYKLGSAPSGWLLD